MDPRAEWLEADGLGGFASGTVSGVRTRRYHALLLHAMRPPTGRVVLVNGFDAWLELPEGRFPITSQRYAPDVTHPDGERRLVSFARDPWPRWTYRLESGAELVQELLVLRGAPVAMLSWRLQEPTAGAALAMRPFLSGRDTHATHHENGAFRFDAEMRDGLVSWRPYGDLPRVHCASNGAYRHDPLWYRNFQYDEEAARGLDFTEDLASPGEFRWDLSRGEAVWIVAADGPDAARLLSRLRRNAVVRGPLLGKALPNPPSGSASALPAGPPKGPPRTAALAAEEIRSLALRGSLPASPPEAVVLSGVTPQECLAEARRFERLRRGGHASPLHCAAEDYIVRRGDGQTIIAGYPWFSDWGRDTFIAMRGLCIASGRLDEARQILLQWAGVVSEGMLPNFFPEGGQAPEYNSVDASLWFVIAVHDLLRALAARGRELPGSERRALQSAVEAILTGYARGTRFGIAAGEDGLLAAGEPGLQLTWMDARVGDRVITPRIGKPVEVQALWINALRIGAKFSARWAPLCTQARESFARRFWNDAAGHLYDVVDVDHRAGEVDPSLRPNQIFAVGGLPYQVLVGRQARRVVEVVEQRLWTPMGPRSLAPGEPGYAPRYGGNMAERDAVYHQGTVWPWLAGPFVEAWVRSRGDTAAVRREARARFLAPLLRHLEAAGLGHVSEIADAEPPHTPRGCPFQAWSVGEALRLDVEVLSEDVERGRRIAPPGVVSDRLA